MPVWHELSLAWRARYDLAVVGIAQEQHAERCALYARWQGFDWPILWDPFNLTETRAVPGVYALDEAGVVRAINPDPTQFEEQFLARDFGQGAPLPPPVPPAWPPRLAGSLDRDPHTEADQVWQSLSRLVFGPRDGSALDRACGLLEQVASTHPDDARARFRLGVALAMRHDSPSRRPHDFQGALDAWSLALAERPNEYIWRRRIQQYGPTLDKPYPFYPWVDQALAALVARGERVPDWPARLTEAERALPRRTLQAGRQSPPDARGAILRDDGRWLELETAVAYATRGEQPVARVHVAFRPRTGRGIHWNNEAGPMLVWFGDPEPPDDWVLDRRLVTLPVDASVPTSAEPRQAELELRLPTGGGTELGGYVLFNACEDVNGQCVYLRRDFRVPLSTP